MLEAGEQAPDFELRDQEGDLVKLSDLEGQTVVLYFYPRADTPVRLASHDDATASGRRHHPRFAASGA